MFLFSVSMMFCNALTRASRHAPEVPAWHGTTRQCLREGTHDCDILRPGRRAYRPDGRIFGPTAPGATNPGHVTKRPAAGVSTAAAAARGLARARLMARPPSAMPSRRDLRRRGMRTASAMPCTLLDGLRRAIRRSSNRTESRIALADIALYRLLAATARCSPVARPARRADLIL